MVSIRYFCGVDEFCRMKSSPRGALVSKSDTGADAMTRAKQQIRMGIHARRSMTMVTSEPSQLAYRAQPVIAHNRNSERRGERGEPGSERDKPYDCWTKRTQSHCVRVTENR